MTDIPHLAPGCFGSALSFQGDHPVCGNCVFKDRCEPVHKTNLEQLRARYGIKLTEKKAPLPKFDHAKAPADALAMPKKVRELLHRLDSAKLNVKERMLRGENPFIGELPYMALFCVLLMKMGTVNRATLEYACKKKLNWSDLTARAHSRMAFQALEHIGAIEVIDGNARLRRD